MPEKKLATPQPPREPLVACEICGIQKPMGQCISYIITCAITGLDTVAAFGCPVMQHYGCSPEHALEAGIACMQEHLHELLLQRHAEKVQVNE